MTLERLTPLLLAADMEETIAFYTRSLGFTLTGSIGEPKTWCSLSRDGVNLMFEWYPPHDHEPGEEHDHPPPTLTGLLYMYPDDVMALHTELASRTEIVQPLRDQPYGMREFAVRDPNGYTLFFGQRL
jgi:uncharacterized glyoxalase superfamily protein PhnB